MMIQFITGKLVKAVVHWTTRGQATLPDLELIWLEPDTSDCEALKVNYEQNDPESQGQEGWLAPA